MHKTIVISGVFQKHSRDEYKEIIETELALVLMNVKNFNVRVSEWQGHVTFHHEIVPGIGHEFPPDFDQTLRRAMDFIFENNKE